MNDLNDPEIFLHVLRWINMSRRYIKDEGILPNASKHCYFYAALRFEQMNYIFYVHQY